MSTILTDHGFLPLSSLRLIVPPLQLVSAALWEIVKQGAVMYYGLLEEFVSTVLDTVPELLTCTERVQLLMGLRAKVVLDLCNSDEFANRLDIQPHLSRINSYIKGQDEETPNSEAKASAANFLNLVNTLIDDQCQRDIFYQKIFPRVFGPDYDSALQALMRKFLLSLHKLLPVPNFEQTSLWLSLSPTTLKECADFMDQPEALNTLIQFHKHHCHKVPEATSSPDDNCILSSLSFHLPNADNVERDTLVKSESVCVSQDWQRDNLLGSGSKEIKEEEDFMEIHSELIRSVETNGQQHVDDLSEHQGASIEVTLQAYDENESNDDDIDQKWFSNVKTSSRMLSKTFKCPVCDKNVGSLTKLKKHMIQQCSATPKPVETKEMLSCETETEPPSVVLQESLDSPQEQMCKRSSRAKQCSVCREVFTCSADLMSHMRCHTEQSPYLCSNCGKDFENFKDYERHEEDKCRGSKQHSQDSSLSNVKKSEPESPVISSVLGQFPKITNGPTNSQAMQLCKALLTCEKCGRVFTYNKNFEKHQSKCFKRADLKAVQQSTSPVTFRECGQAVVHSKNFDNRRSKCTVRGHGSEKQAYPNYSMISGCNFQSADNTSGSHDETAKTDNCPARSHTIIKLHKVMGAYPCSLCKKTFLRLSELVQHQQNRKLYQCATCKKCFSESHLKFHENKHAACVTPHICETCGKSFRVLSYLVLHQRKHRQQKPNICSYCGKHYSSRQCLKEHMARHTGGYSCQVCDKKFYRKLHLEWHLYKHTGKEPYRCDTCGKDWPTPAHLKLHMIQHHEDRPFKCEDCGVCYKRRNHLNAHRSDIHYRLRKFYCEVCRKAFRLRGELKRHMLVHKTNHGGPFTRKRNHTNSASKNSFCKTQLHPKPSTSGFEAEVSSFASKSLPDFEEASDDCSLVCRVCARVFTYRKNFDKHQKICVIGSKRQAETDQQCSTSLAHHSKPNPADKTAESLPCETKSGPSDVVPKENSDSPQEQAWKRHSRVHKCSVCLEKFNRSVDLMSHMRCHIEESPYLCCYCGKDFENSEDYETHQVEKCRVSEQHSQDNHLSKAKKGKQENPVVSSVVDQGQTITGAPANSQSAQPWTSTLTCQKCERVFTYNKNFERHQSTCCKRAKSKALHQNKSPITCQDCGRVFVHSKNFENHQSKCAKRFPRRKKQAYPNYANYSIISGCNFQSADNTSQSRDKTSSETVETPGHADGSAVKSHTFKCTMCERKFSKIWLMNLHYSKAHKVRDAYSCSLCKRTFLRLSELVRHQQNRKLFQCTSCKKCFLETSLIDHENRHTGCVTPCTCETCGKRFKVLSYLVLHQRKHTKLEPNICSYCGKQYSSKQCLKAHMVRHTGGYPCPVCGKKFNQKTYLKWHLNKHTGKALYLCDTCGKGWPTASQLKVHMVQHSEERPFKCEDCGVCYKRRGHLNAHRRAVHIRLRPFMCKVCGKAFRLNGELKRHTMVHTGERPFLCPRCGKTFVRKFHLRQHSKKACR